ncbi:phosphoribosylglycinamide formyltransferase-1 [Desulfonauticus submarinus]|uniref:Phosphoribosylglycinamide formyltransferase n=1 Tax=Desulfonauticus submarinus TaxID=206665 RepID=A0A1H0DGG2_9BACT|nr:phosphoribosylglycinamide formyltransferase [Desulfonauticus submarinus]SDN69109.1 phosphoribosylglycinamide formyltransferase-1 [Desulfonauticus submarinus]
MLPIAVLISGSGSNLQSIIDKIESGALQAEIKVVISNNPKAYGLERAKKHGLKRTVIEHTKFSSREDFEKRLVSEIEDAGAKVVILAGFMRILSPYFVRSFAQRILNIHPAILPSFPGLHGQKQAAQYGVKVSGCTVHFVDEKMDHGPIIIQAVVPALPEDDGNTLGERILKWEHRIYPQAISWLAEKRIEICGRKVKVKNAQPCFLGPFNEPGLVSPGLEDKFF